ncbi:hypothetical protein [Streptomyces chattanoogensis]|uniref:hypothetical protein n=1 Tax=Streptomyces chattanoogensis TaxID=66876 RepID=UPI0036A437E1
MRCDELRELIIELLEAAPRVAAVAQDPKYALDGVPGIALTMASPFDLDFFIEVHPT